VLNWFRRKREPDVPFVRRQIAGRLKVISGVVLMGDPMYLQNAADALRLENVPVGDHSVIAQVIHFPEGGRRVAGIELAFATTANGSFDKLGEIGVDSASVAILDAKTHEQFWKNEGPARIGVLSTPEHQKIAKLLKKRFGLKSEPVHVVRSELVQPVSTELEAEIVAYLKTFPEYAEYTCMYFRIETRNTFDQLQDNLDSQGLWCELTLEKSNGANVLAFESGFGDGCYLVTGIRDRGQMAKVAVEFIDPTGEEILEMFPSLRQ
jgi:hypothetical protein